VEHMPGAVARKARSFAQAGDYNQAVAVASLLVPGMEHQLEQFRVRMRAFESAKAIGHWREAVSALTDARMAALAAGIPELAQVASDQLFRLVKEQEVREP